MIKTPSTTFNLPCSTWWMKLFPVFMHALERKAGVWSKLINPSTCMYLFNYSRNIREIGVIVTLLTLSYLLHTILMYTVLESFIHNTPTNTNVIYTQIYCVNWAHNRVPKLLFSILNTSAFVHNVLKPICVNVLIIVWTEVLLKMYCNFTFKCMVW